MTTFGSLRFTDHEDQTIYFFRTEPLSVRRTGVDGVVGGRPTCRKLVPVDARTVPLLGFRRPLRKGPEEVPGRAKCHVHLRPPRRTEESKRGGRTSHQTDDPGASATPTPLNYPFLPLRQRSSTHATGQVRREGGGERDTFTGNPHRPSSLLEFDLTDFQRYLFPSMGLTHLTGRPGDDPYWYPLSPLPSGVCPWMSVVRTPTERPSSSRRSPE